LRTGTSPSQNREDQEQFVLFTINVDWSISLDIILADISSQSDFLDENEVLFDIGTTFEITEIYYNCELNTFNVFRQKSLKIM
jgi:hypothetical protein